MRAFIALPLAAAFVLGACGSSEDLAEDGEVTAEEVASAAASFDGPRPGEYRNTVEIEEFTMPGMPAAMMGQMSGQMTGRFSHSFCLSETDGEKAVKQMTDNMGRGDCTYRKLEVSGNRVEGDMTCNSPEGGTGTYRFSGTTSTEGVDMDMEMKQEMPGGGPGMHMKAKFKQERVGDC